MMEVGFLLHNNNGSDNDLTERTLFLTTPKHLFMVVGKVTTVYINMSYCHSYNTVIHKAKLK